MRALNYFSSFISSAGGFVHDDLKLLVGEGAEHGLISLSGVPSDTLSLIVPLSLGETDKKRGRWVRYLESLGYEIDADFFNSHSIRRVVLPLFSAANHNADGGRVEVDESCVYLYGVDFSYSDNADLLKSQWGIEA